MPRHRRLFLAAGIIGLSSVVAAQTAGTPAALTSADYARAERFMGYHTAPLVLRAGVRPSWISPARFWYRVTGERGPETWLVDASAASRVPCILPVCGTPSTPPASRPAEVRSPDGAAAVFIRDWNLWMREVATGRETALTRDGTPDFGYATDNAGWTRSDRPILAWSPDSSKIATFQQDERGVGDMHLVETRVGHPTLQTWKYPLPGDAVLPRLHRVIIDVRTAETVRLQLAPEAHRSSACDDISCRGGEWTDVQWSDDSATLAFVSTSRDHKRATLRLADASSGAVRDVLEETADTYFESGIDRANWRYLKATSEVIWFSERDNWGQLYLYDSLTGRLKNRMTSGDGNVVALLHVDARDRVVYFVGVGKERGRDPYYRHLYRVGLDGRRFQLLTPADANHEVSLSPDGSWFVDVHSTPETPPVAELRDARGGLVMPLERADVSRLVATGWRPPRPIAVKARDSATTLYGLMYTPTSLDTSKQYPIVNHIYPGPQSGSVGSRSFAAARGDAQALAELGFVVVEIDGMGTPFRSKRFHDAAYGDLGDNTLPDQVTGMQQLAQQFPWIDISRAGIYGHSGGGYAAAAAMFRYPDFFTMGVSQAGNHDNRSYEDDWGEKWQGLLETRPDGTSSYERQANQLIAGDLKGKLLLAHGTLDTNVPPYNTLLVVNALIAANKDFDLVLLPNRGHGFADEPYMLRRRWDYFVRHLLGAEPPFEYRMQVPQ